MTHNYRLELPTAPVCTQLRRLCHTQLRSLSFDQREQIEPWQPGGAFNKGISVWNWFTAAFALRQQKCGDLPIGDRLAEPEAAVIDAMNDPPARVPGTDFFVYAKSFSVLKILHQTSRQIVELEPRATDDESRKALQQKLGSFAAVVCAPGHGIPPGRGVDWWWYSAPQSATRAVYAAHFEPNHRRIARLLPEFPLFNSSSGELELPEEFWATVGGWLMVLPDSLKTDFTLPSLAAVYAAIQQFEPALAAA